MTSILSQQPEVLCSVEAIYAFHSSESSTLSFEKGDHIEVFTKLDSGWWNGWCKGKRGWFPSNFVEVISEGSASGLQFITKFNSSKPSHHQLHMNDYIMEDEYSIFDEDHNESIDSTRDSYISQPISAKPEKNNGAQLSKQELMDSWVERKTPQGRSYYCNLITQETTWDYSEIDPKTGRLKKKHDEKEDQNDEVSSKTKKQTMERNINDDEDKDRLTWNKLSSDIAHAIHQLISLFQEQKVTEYQNQTSIVINSIRVMLYASRSLDKDSSILVSNPTFKDHRKVVISSLSKLVISSKMTSEGLSEPVFQKFQRDANDVLIAVRNFVNIYKKHNVPVYFVNPKLLEDAPYDLPESNNKAQTIDSKRSSIDLEFNNSTQKTKFSLNQDLISNLQAYIHQIFGFIDELSSINSFFKEETYPENLFKEERDRSVAAFKTLSFQVSQFIGLLDEINFENTSSVNFDTYSSDRQNLYESIGTLFSAIQALTNVSMDVVKSSNLVDETLMQTGNALESIEQTIIMMVTERKRTQSVKRHTSSSNQTIKHVRNDSFIDGELFDPFLQMPKNQEILDSSSSIEPSISPSVSSGISPSISSGISPSISSGLSANFPRKKYSLRSTSDRSLDSNDTFIGSEDLEVGSDNVVKGGTLAALVERLTTHDVFDTNFITTFLLTYRSFCTTEEFIGLLEERYNILPPERLTPEKLEEWTERKQKLIRLRVFNVLKNWLENYYIDEDAYLLNRIEHFTNTNIRDSSSLSANQLLKLISNRMDQGEMKKIIPNPINGPEPIYPKNKSKIQLLETDALEMARQLCIMDFKLYSSIRPIECLGKAWSKEDASGNIAFNVKQSIQYCNRLTTWVTESILSYEEAKKRAIVIKFWVQVADHCRGMNNFNTCMAIMSAFDNSAVGRLKKTWMLVNKSTTIILAQLRKLMGANRNFLEYREIIHSINPPCIPFLGIYLQDLTFIEDGNSDYLRSSNLINFAKRQKTAEVIRELKQFQSFAYNFHTIIEFQNFIQSRLAINYDIDELYERSLRLEPRINEMNAAVNNLLNTLG